MAMTKVFTRKIPLSDLFPPGDRIAALVAHLCILKEDFHLEYRGLVQEKTISELDQNTSMWRRTYFFRTFLRTLNEILNITGIIEGDEEVRKLLKQTPQNLRSELNGLVALVKGERDLISRLRNSIGGHLDHRAVQRAIKKMAPERQGTIQLGPTLGKTRYYFTTELIESILMAVTQGQDPLKQLEEEMERIGQLQKPLMQAIDKIFTAYLHEQGFLDRR